MREIRLSFFHSIRRRRAIASVDGSPLPPARCLRAASFPERVTPPRSLPPHPFKPLFYSPTHYERCFHAVSLSVLFLSLVSRIFSSTRATISL